MGGDSYDPVVVYGYRADDKDELAQLKKALQEMPHNHAKYNVDIFYCTDSAYSRWEGEDNEELWADIFDKKWRLQEGFAVLGIEIHNLNKNIPSDVLQALQNLIVGREPAYDYGIELLRESDKEESDCFPHRRRRVLDSDTS